MNIDNKPSGEPRVMGEFKNFTQDRFKDAWKRVIGEEESIIRERHVKKGQELPVVETEKFTKVKAIFDAGENISIISWKNEEGATKFLSINGDYLVGVERAITGQEAVVIMKSKEGKQTIRKYYKSE
jgi:hypothetical protein